MSPLVSRHGVKDVENSLGGGERGKKREREEKQCVTKNDKIQVYETSPFYGLTQVKDREERRLLGWEWDGSWRVSENLGWERAGGTLLLQVRLGLFQEILGAYSDFSA